MTPRRMAATVALTVALMLALVACSSPQGGSSGGTNGGAPKATAGNTVTEQNTQFEPSTLTVKPGDTVTFENNDSVPHEVEIDGKNLGEQQSGESKTWKAGQAGTYPYRCLIHPSMTGTIRVQ